MNDEFGPSYAAVLLRDLVLTELDDRTGELAISEGEDPKLVWFAICRANAVPPERWHGIIKKTKA